MKTKYDKELEKLLEEDFLNELQGEKEMIREEAKENIAKIQDENRKSFNKSRKPESEYKLGDLVAIKITQFGAGLKLKNKYLGPYPVTPLRHGRYLVEKVGDEEGPNKTNTVTECMKLWSSSFGSIELSE
ncbi:hypothetical protein KR026_006449 [Drosophila bipectinata]|nr:hypothetical protein KR026_006449 [Drosophila bipectinata]